MSEDYLTVLPDDPWWVPSPDRAAAAVAVLDALMDRESEISVRGPGPLTLECAAGEFGTVTCPDCAVVLASNPEDMAWFTTELDGVLATADDSRCLDVALPCCGVTRSMNDLLYDPSAGFSSWSVTARRPVYQFDDRQRALVVAALGHDVRVVEYHL